MKVRPPDYKLYGTVPSVATCAVGSEGDVVDLTNDSGVEDSDDVVELAATDVQV